MEMLKEIFKDVLIVNYVFVFIFYLANFERFLYRREISKKELLLVLIPFMFLFCVIKLLIIILKETILELIDNIKRRNK